MTCILVFGGRYYRDRASVFRSLDHVVENLRLRNPDDEIVVIHGACPTGADAFADEFARERGLGIRKHPASWGVHGRAAGPIRNARMLREERVDLAIGFPGEAGTRDMSDRVRRAKIPLMEIPL